ncbi:type I-E CRISPR-associated protein Cse2/CasB [Deinococcus sp.]|uniref:type I-E CRISPR-associated protein Cse2/CasB n=1 Tax=Deinococcus sp. TaxID=47478 RepID=UPI0025F129FC|nr:type I-E CRISPR-associated protein Cse2/CasB [Deinococcus sp.]
MTQPVPDRPRSPAERFEPLLQNLSRLDRGRLAALRRSLGDDQPGQSVPWLEGVFLRSGLVLRSDRQWRALAVVAGLYALIERPSGDDLPIAPDHRPSFGQTFGQLYLSQDQRPSTEKRFLALLEADVDGLPYALRQAVTLLKAAELHPDWALLMADISLWNHETFGERVRRRWALDFYRSAERVSETDLDPAVLPTGTIVPEPAPSDEGDTL